MTKAQPNHGMSVTTALDSKTRTGPSDPKIDGA